jgi:hypothetical protein
MISMKLKLWRYAALGALVTGFSAAQIQGITVALDANNTVAIAWNGAGVLEESTTLTNDWSQIPQAVTSSLVSISGDYGFWRVQWPTFQIVDTNQTVAFDVDSELTEPPAMGEPFHGQDASYTGAQPSFTDNGDGTVTDNVTGLMWQQDPGAKMTWNAGVAGAATLDLAGYGDWRLPTIKELYSLMADSLYRHGVFHFRIWGCPG